MIVIWSYRVPTYIIPLLIDVKNQKNIISRKEDCCHYSICTVARRCPLDLRLRSKIYYSTQLHVWPIAFEQL